MREFFHGWRRKAGCVLLVAAAALLGVWIRSGVIPDYMQYEWGGSVHTIKSENATLSWTSCDSVERQEYMRLELRRQRTDHSGSIEIPLPRSYRKRTVDYWSITLPLTLLSAYLILWKPRKRVAP